MDEQTVPDTRLSDWEHEIIIHGYSQLLPLNDRGFLPIGGDMGPDNADFHVSEIPAYLPCGEGEHVYLWIEKCGHPTQDVIRILERVFQVKEPAIGCAGKKDAHAITRQWLSVQTHQPEEETLRCIEKINETPWLKVLTHSRHTNKLRMGHLTGNRFQVMLDNVCGNDEVVASACSFLQSNGFINYFGRQRFGTDRANIAEGLRVMNGARMPHHKKLIFISAIQSALFNLVCARRFESSGFTIFKGDVLKKKNGGCFVCEDPETDNIRAQNAEIDITVALPGKKVMTGNGCSEQWHNQAMDDFIREWQNQEDFKDMDFSRLLTLADGERRVMRVFPEGISFTRLDEKKIQLEFSLPSGSYATVFLRHICGSTFSR